MSTTIKFDQAEIRDGWLCLKPCEYVDTVNAKAFCFGFKGVYDAELKKHYNKRSLNSNNYAWKLITDIANELRRNKEDVYLDLLKSYGQGGAVSVQERYAEQFKRTYKYHESLGKSFLKGCMWEHFRFWIGSSQYNSQEMSIFIDGIVDEAKSMGIETLTPEELARMNLDWDNEGVIE
jgi:hypothetical protein